MRSPRHSRANGLGTILSDKGRFEESEEHFRQALEIGARSDDAVYTPLVKMNYAGMHHERGLVLERTGMKAEAHAHYRAGIKLCEEASVGWGLEAFGRAYRDGMLGELYRELGETEKARLLFGEMLHYATEGANPHQQAEALDEPRQDLHGDRQARRGPGAPGARRWTWPRSPRCSG